MQILITGASSGLGAALARHYSKKGHTLYLGGRNLIRLRLVAEECERRGAVARPHVVDVTDQTEMQKWIGGLEEPLNLVIANAGVSGGTAGDVAEEAQQIEAILRTNIEGVANTINPALVKMQAVKQGQIAIISSLAGFRGFAGAPAYCASKAAVRVYGEALRSFLLPHNIKVNVICPGYVKTPMTDVNDFRMPMMMDSEKASVIIAKGLEKNKARIAFPKRLYFIVWLLSVLPAGLTDRFIAKLPRKNVLKEGAVE